MLRATVRVKHVMLGFNETKDQLSLTNSVH